MVEFYLLYHLPHRVLVESHTVLLYISDVENNLVIYAEKVSEVVVIHSNTPLELFHHSFYFVCSRLNRNIVGLLIHNIFYRDITINM